MNAVFMQTGYVLKRQGLSLGGKYQVLGLQDKQPLLYIEEKVKWIPPFTSVHVYFDDKKKQEFLTVKDRPDDTDMDVIDVETIDSEWVTNGFIQIHPQIWRVRFVEQNKDGSIVVHDLDIVNGAGKLAINFDDLEQLVVFVFGQTRYTTTPASYIVKVSPDSK